MMLLVIVVVIVILIIFIIAVKKVKNNKLKETNKEFTSANITSEIVVPLSRDQFRSAYWIPAYVGGRVINAIADTGSALFIVPNSLPCPDISPCTKTGERTKVSYGDGTKGDATFAFTHIDIGSNHFPSLLFGGSKGSGTGSAAAHNPILGLATLTPPEQYKQLPGKSIIEQLNVTLLEFDLTSEYDAWLKLAPSSKYANTNGKLVAEGPLMSKDKLWELGINKVANFYVIQLPKQSDELGDLEYLIIDTGTTMTLLPKVPEIDTKIKFPKGSIEVSRGEVGPTPLIYHGKEGEFLNPKIGLLGNRTMTGYRVILDLNKLTCRIYK